MKLRNLFAFVLVSAMAFVACEQEQDLGTPNLTLSASEVVLPQEGGDTTLTLTATRDWMVELDTAATKWLVVDPSSGVASASEQTVTVSALANDGYDREASLVFSIGMQKKYLTVKQAGSKGSADALVIYSNDYDKEVAEKTYGSGSSWPYLDQFEGWKNQKGTGAANVTYAFSGMSARSNSTSDSNYSDYSGSGNNNMFFGKSAYLATNGIALGETTNLELTIGTEKYSQDNGSVFKNEEFHIWLSADGGAKWVELTDYTFAGGTTEGRWNVATANFSVPAGTAALSICMAVDVASSYRMDDFKLVASAKEGTAVDFSKAVAKDFGAGSTGGGNTGGDNTGGSTQTWPTDVYTKVSQVTSSKKYVIFAEGIVAKPIEASRTYGYLFENSVTLDSEGKITTSDEYGFVFTAVEGGYTIMQSDGRFLYVADDDYKNFNVSKEPTSGHVWKVEAQSDGTFKITNVLAPKWIQFSSGYNSYGAYRETQDASFLPCLYEGTKDLTVQEGDNTGGDNTGGGNTGGDIDTGSGDYDASIVFKDAGYQNEAKVTEVKIDENITAVFAKGAANNDPAYYDNGEAVRMYQNGSTLDIKAAEGKTITEIRFTFAQNHYYIGCDAGTLSAEAATRVWKGSANAVKFTTTGTDKSHRAYVASIEVAYE